MVYDTNLFSIKKKLCHLDFSQITILLAHPVFYQTVKFTKALSPCFYFWWGLDIILHKYHLIKIIQQCQEIGLIFSAKCIKILLLLGLATPHAKKLYFLCTTLQGCTCLIGQQIGHCNLLQGQCAMFNGSYNLLTEIISD